MIEKLKRLYRYFFRRQPKFNYTIKLKSERHGNTYGGWNICKNSLNENSIVYSFGIGNDISFDNSIISSYNCKVFAFDPTPNVKIWLQNQDLSKKFVFIEKGLANHDGFLEFFEPINPNHISHTAFNFGNTKKFLVPCEKLSTLMKELGHDSIDLLKIDIEGFEYEVLKNIIKDKVNINQLLVEFHHFFPNVGNEATENSIKLLEENGFRLFSVSDSFCEYSFIKLK